MFTKDSFYVASHTDGFGIVIPNRAKIAGIGIFTNAQCNTGTGITRTCIQGNLIAIRITATRLYFYGGHSIVADSVIAKIGAG